ncbi:hypothetical protein BH23ACT6_BH23ACT6_13800 [soil metagenome]
MSSGPQWAIAEARSQCLADITALAPQAPAELADAEGMFVIRSWTEPHRVYHGLRHVAEMLSVLGRLARQIPALDDHAMALARMAAWYHDVAYDPRATPGSNEQRSASIARDHLHRLGAATRDVDAIEAVIVMTCDHRASAAAGAASPELVDAFHDADLWILSAPAQRYREYARQVHDEYAHVPAALFASSRAMILRGFIDREHIYRTAYARAHWEGSARTNIADELTVLDPR